MTSPGAHWACALLLLLVSTPADAFSPAIHRALTARAVALEAEAHPALAAMEARMARAAAGEDWNVARKWLFWSHYYSPRFPIPIVVRGHSDGRVARLVTAIGRALDSGRSDVGFRKLGLAAHHVQDMASPPHVVPVAHGLGDGFESIDMTGLVERVRGDGVAAMDPIAAQRALAVETRDLVDTATLPCGVALSAIWHAREDRFGRGGDVDFGELAIPCQEAFVRDRLDRALAYTRAIVRWSAERETASVR